MRARTISKCDYAMLRAHTPPAWDRDEPRRPPSRVASHAAPTGVFQDPARTAPQTKTGALRAAVQTQRTSSAGSGTHAHVEEKGPHLHAGRDCWGPYKYVTVRPHTEAPALIL